MLTIPSKPKVPCRQPGCPELVLSGTKYCERHKALHPEEIRSAASRGYNRTWQKASKQYLAAHPLCVMCLNDGVFRKATVVDHIVPHRGDEELFWDRTNWQPLCKKHHDRKTLTEDINPKYKY